MRPAWSEKLWSVTKFIRKSSSVKSRNHGGSLMQLKEELVERLWKFQLVCRNKMGLKMMISSQQKYEHFPMKLLHSVNRRNLNFMKQLDLDVKGLYNCFTKYLLCLNDGEMRVSFHYYYRMQNTCKSRYK
jgi:hypothetical protein